MASNKHGTACGSQSGLPLIGVERGGAEGPKGAEGVGLAELGTFGGLDRVAESGLLASAAMGKKGPKDPKSGVSVCAITTLQLQQ